MAPFEPDRRNTQLFDQDAATLMDQPLGGPLEPATMGWGEYVGMFVIIVCACAIACLINDLLMVLYLKHALPGLISDAITSALSRAATDLFAGA